MKLHIAVRPKLDVSFKGGSPSIDNIGIQSNVTINDYN